MSKSAATEKVTLIKKDGRQFENVYAILSKDSVFIEDGTLPLDQGDHLVFRAGASTEEVFRVVEPGHRPAIQMFKEHYQATVERIEGQVLHEESQPSRDWRYFNQCPIPEVFKHTRKLLFENCERERQSELLLVVDELESKRGTLAYISAYQRFVQKNAEYLKVLAPVLPALTKLLSTTGSSTN